MDENKKEIIETYIEKIGMLRDQAINELFDGDALDILEEGNTSVEKKAEKVTEKLDEIIEEAEEFLLENQK